MFITIIGHIVKDPRRHTNKLKHLRDDPKIKPLLDRSVTNIIQMVIDVDREIIAALIRKDLVIATKNADFLKHFDYPEDPLQFYKAVKGLVDSNALEYDEDSYVEGIREKLKDLLKYNLTLTGNTLDRLDRFDDGYDSSRDIFLCATISDQEIHALWPRSEIDW